MTNSLASIIDQNIRLGEGKLTGRNIRHFRWMHGMTRENLGFRIGISEKEIEELESGERHITARELKKIASALDVSMAALTKGFETYAHEVNECLAAKLSIDEAFGLVARHATPQNALPQA